MRWMLSVTLCVLGIAAVLRVESYVGAAVVPVTLLFGAYCPHSFLDHLSLSILLKLVVAVFVVVAAGNFNFHPGTDCRIWIFQITLTV